MPAQLADHVDSSAAVGNRLKSRRLELGLRQGDIAAKGITVGYISRIEAGFRTPSMQVIQHLAARLGVSESWLARGDDGHVVRLTDRSFATVVRVLTEAAGSGGRPLEALIELDPKTAEQFILERKAARAAVGVAADLVELEGGRIGRAA